MQKHKRSSQVGNATSEEKRFKGIEFDFNKTINEIREENSLSPIDDPLANALFKPINEG